MLCEKIGSGMRVRFSKIYTLSRTVTLSNLLSLLSEKKNLVVKKIILPLGCKLTPFRTRLVCTEVKRTVTIVIPILPMGYNLSRDTECFVVFEKGGHTNYSTVCKQNNHHKL